MNRSKFRFIVPLHTIIAGFFITLVVAFGSLLGWYNYKETSQLLLDASGKVFDQVQKELSLNYQGAYKPVATAVKVISTSNLGMAEELEERLTYLAMLKMALEEATYLSGLQVGYDNGDYFIIRPLNRGYLKERFKGPKGASFVVDNLTTADDGKRYMERIWFSQTLNEVGREPLQATEYDPRVRPWYLLAQENTEVRGTDPYHFHFIDQAGFTITYKSPHGAVIAGDVTLTQLSETLANNQITENTELVVFSEEKIGT